MLSYIYIYKVISMGFCITYILDIHIPSHSQCIEKGPLRIIYVKGDGHYRGDITFHS
jgi:hypothetical protein